MGDATAGTRVACWDDLMVYSAVGWMDTHWVSPRDMMKAARRGVATAVYLGMQTAESWGDVTAHLTDARQAAATDTRMAGDWAETRASQMAGM